jgi:hypothetical protein
MKSNQNRSQEENTAKEKFKEEKYVRRKIIDLQIEKRQETNQSIK